MVQGSLLMEQIEAAARFLREFEKSTPIVVAFWLKEAEDGQWYLYVASDRFNKGKLGGAYGDVLRIAQEMKEPYFEPFQVKLVGLSEATVQAALEFYLTHPPKIPFRVRERHFGGIDVEEVYL